MRARVEAGERSPGRSVPSPQRLSCFLYEPGRLCYSDALKLQLDLHRACASGDIPGVLILLEHNPVITMGVKTAPSNLLASEESLAERGIELAKTDRGGDITYHGPGQLVGYPIIRLKDHCADVHDYLRTLEQTIIDTLASFGIEGTRHGPAGVWVGDRKVCSIGVAVRKWVTYHGFAFNVDPDMSHFTLINPCGLRSEQLTSLRELLGTAPDMAEVKATYADAFAAGFGVDLTRWDGSTQ
jgi:lipoate-protein ligase B